MNFNRNNLNVQRALSVDGQSSQKQTNERGKFMISFIFKQVK